MEMPKFGVITIAECDSNYLSRALELTRELKDEIEEKGNPVSIRFGILITGHHAGAMAFFQNYSTLSDFERSYGIFQASEHYQTLFNCGAAKVASRNLIKFSPVEYEENLIVAGGGNNSDTIFYSSDLGITWTAVSNSSSLFTSVVVRLLKSTS